MSHHRLRELGCETYTDAVGERLGSRDLLATLRAKLKAGEKMTMREINALIALLNKEEQSLRRPPKV